MLICGVVVIIWTEYGIQTIVGSLFKISLNLHTGGAE